MTLFKVVWGADPSTNKLFFQAASLCDGTVMFCIIIELPTCLKRGLEIMVCHLGQLCNVPAVLNGCLCTECEWSLTGCFFVCLCGCMICVWPSIRSQLEQLLPPRFPFSLAFIKNGSVNSTVYNKTNAVANRQDGIRWLFHPAMAQREAVWENQVERSRNKYLSPFCEFCFKSSEMLSSQLLHIAV